MVAGICNLIDGGVFLAYHCSAISVDVKARVLNGKQVDVAASRADRSGCPGMRQLLTARHTTVGMH